MIKIDETGVQIECEGGEEQALYEIGVLLDAMAISGFDWLELKKENLSFEDKKQLIVSRRDELLVYLMKKDDVFVVDEELKKDIGE